MSDLSQILEKGVLVNLSGSVWGGRKKTDSAEVLKPEGDGNPNPDMVATTKYLIDSKALKKVNSIRGEARTYLAKKSLPFPLDGVVFIPAGLLGTVDGKLSAYKMAFEEAVVEFLTKYATLKEEARAKLGNLYSEKDYPMDISSKFGFDWSFFALTDIQKADWVDDNMRQRETQKMKKMVQEFEDTAVAALRDQFGMMLGRLAENLSQGKRFHASSVEGFKNFLEDFSSLNISNDVDLARLVDQAKGFLAGKSAEDLKAVDLQKQVAQAMEVINAEFMSQIKDKPIRKLGI